MASAREFLLSRRQALSVSKIALNWLGPTLDNPDFTPASKHLDDSGDSESLLSLRRVRQLASLLRPLALLPSKLS